MAKRQKLNKAFTQHQNLGAGVYPASSNKGAGFSLIEILVSMTIVLIVTVAISATFLDMMEEMALYQFKDQLITDLRYAQIKSINSTHNFGIHIESETEAILFRDDIAPNDIYNTGDARIRTINLPEGVVFLFPPVNNNIVFGREGELSPPLSPPITLITIEITDNFYSKIISINQIGLIK